MAMDNRTSRSLNLVVGAWLFVSAFAWLHTDPQYNNAWVVGMLSMAAAAAAIAMPAFRYLNTALSVWLFASVWILPRESMTTAWNSMIVAGIMFLISMLGSEPLRARTPRRRFS
jgi:zinc transporter ZupT